MVVFARCRILASWWFREVRNAAGLSAKWDNCSIRPRSMEAMRAARMPWPITSQTMAPTPELPTGKASNQSPATPSEGVKMWWKSTWRVRPCSVWEREGISYGSSANWISRAKSISFSRDLFRSSRMRAVSVALISVFTSLVTSLEMPTMPLRSPLRPYHGNLLIWLQESSLWSHVSWCRRARMGRPVAMMSSSSLREISDIV